MMQARTSLATMTLTAAALLGACTTTLPADDTPIDGSVEVAWQVGASGCELSGVSEVVVEVADRSASAACTDGSLMLDVPAGDHTVALWGLDDGGVARYEGATRADVRAGEAVTLPTVVMGALPATIDVTWYFENGRLCGGNGVTDVEIVLFDDDFIVETLATTCDDGIERLPDVLAGNYTVSVLARDAEGAVQFSGSTDARVDKGDLAFVEVMLADGSVSGD